MSQELDVREVAGALRVSVGLLLRRLRQVHAEGELTMPETAALARLDRGGPTTASALARQEQISPQSMGATLAGLEARALIERQADRRRAVISLTEAGLKVLRSLRDAKTSKLADALAIEFTPAELGVLAQATPLIERLAQSI